MASLEQCLGIYIHCHGRLEEKYVKAPLNITKQNLGGYGCPSYGVRDQKTYNEVAMSLTHGITGCSQEEYTHMFKGKVDTYGQPIDTEESCQLFHGKREWINKRYTFDKSRKYLLFSLFGKVINIVDCSREELENFLGITENIFDKQLSSFFERRIRGTITTEDIFMLINCIKKIHGITKANILDESCNIVKSSEKTTVLHKGAEVTGNFPIPKSAVFKLRDDAGYGGKRSRKRYSKSSKIR